jgi:thymidylate synthase
LVVHQFFVDKGTLSLLVFQRSADVLLGLPIDIAGSAILLHMVARVVGLQSERLIFTLGDVHLYKTHVTQAAQLLKRSPLTAPRIVFHTAPKLPFDYKEEDISIDGYQPHSAIWAPIAV